MPGPYLCCWTLERCDHAECGAWPEFIGITENVVGE